jgi:hypothetical protein
MATFTKRPTRVRWSSACTGPRQAAASLNPSLYWIGSVRARWCQTSEEHHSGESVTHAAAWTVGAGAGHIHALRSTGRKAVGIGLFMP